MKCCDCAWLKNGIHGICGYAYTESFDDRAYYFYRTQLSPCKHYKRKWWKFWVKEEK